MISNLIVESKKDVPTSLAVLRSGYLAFVVIIVTSCARPAAPIGGPMDNVGPQVVSSTPDTFAIIDDFRGPIEVVFDERISETATSGTLQDAVQISPMEGDIVVIHRSRSLEIEMEGGFSEDMVYRVTVLPIVKDLFQNAMPYPFEFLFSTGAEMMENVVAGTVADGTTLRPSFGTTVIASVESHDKVLLGEGMPRHIAVTDSSGVYAFRYLPVGNYSITAFVDENRNDDSDPTEPIADTYLTVEPNDTVFADMRVLRPDSTPPVLNAVGIVDSLTLLVEFDDYLSPGQFSDGRVRATLASDSSDFVEIRQMLDGFEYGIRREMLRGTTSVIDSEKMTDSASIIAKETAFDNRIPSQTVYLLLTQPIRVGASYEVTISGLVNINGIGPGGGSATVVRNESNIPGDTLTVLEEGLVYER
ncbi:MAG: hypothetical protein CME30_03100 [Gemmatimonadetes bacterium]|nr:hypothetical protein [Gemmatimonadota bacterium]